MRQSRYRNHYEQCCHSMVPIEGQRNRKGRLRLLGVVLSGRPTMSASMLPEMDSRGRCTLGLLMKRQLRCRASTCKAVNICPECKRAKLECNGGGTKR